MVYDVAVVGGGPAGSTCAMLCARGGLRTLLLERAVFPREKVCGDCLNPDCWPILRRLGVADEVRALPHATLDEVRITTIGGRSVRLPLRSSLGPEIAVKRSLLDSLLLQRAVDAGVDAKCGHPLTAFGEGSVLHAGAAKYEARVVVAADGRNSFVARQAGLLPILVRDRVALQTHVRKAGDEFQRRVELRFRREGYCGIAGVSDDEINVCLVSRPANVEALKAWAGENVPIPSDQRWQTMTPLSRAPVKPSKGNLLLVGDAARVVEPFTGEGIFYALASGELAAVHIVAQFDTPNCRKNFGAYTTEHAALYKGRLWVNRLASEAVLHPRLGSAAVQVLRFAPWLLEALLAKIVRPARDD